jgi:flavin-dependent dehydrogenase
MKVYRYLIFTAAVLFAPLCVGAASSVVESKKSLPLAYDVDVVVAGGSLAGVEAACAAAEAGASVLLVESRSYLGYDICANQKLWLDPDEQPQTKITKHLFQDKRQVTPLQVKSLLDRVLLEREIQFLTGSFPAELLVDEKGRPSGLTMVNRSGRQAIRAKVVIDATPHGVLVRQCSGTLTPFEPGKRAVEFTVIGEHLQAGDESVRGHQVPGVTFKSKVKPVVDGQVKRERVTKQYSAFTYDATIELKTDTFRAHSSAEHRVRSKLVDPSVADHSESLLVFPERVIITESGDRAEPYSLGNFRPKGMDNLFVLSGYAGIKDTAARHKLLKSPCLFAPIGQRVGAEAASVARKTSSPQRLDHLPASGETGTLAASEIANSFRFRDRPQVELSDHDLPVLGRWDVVVVGGGTSGAPAALGAARSGARTLAIEYMNELGGVGTAGLISTYWYGFRFGYTAEVDKALGTKESWVQVAKSEWLRRELVKSGAEVWFSSFGCGAVMEGNKVSGVIVATPFGRGVVLADVVIDSTGNADIAAAARAQTQYSISKHGDLSVQITNNPVRKLGDATNNPARYMVHDSDVFDRAHLKLSGRQNYASGYDMGQLIPSRDRRRVVGDYVLTTEDILTKRTFPDTISHHRSNFDAGAHPDTELFLLKDMKGPVFTCDLPYRSVTPKGLEGILMTGLGTSTTRDAMTLTRMQPDLQNQGYAVGMAASMAVLTTGGKVREIDLKSLQKELVKYGCLEERVLTDSDSFPLDQEVIAEAVKQLNALTISVHQKPEFDDTHFALAVVLSHPKQAIPLLREEYSQASNPATKQNFARILAILGDVSGKDSLIEALRSAPNWGRGWDYSNQRKYANSFGDVDRLVIALGFIQAPEVRVPLLKKLNALTINSPLSHYKAVCLALRMNKDGSMAKSIADFLRTSGLKGHAQVLGYYDDKRPQGDTYKRNALDTKGGKGLNTKFKELLVAALLFECGDDQGEGRKILEAYTKDVNGHFAEYAHHVLTTIPPLKRTQYNLEVTPRQAGNQSDVTPAPSNKKKSRGKAAKNSWASQDEWNREKPGYEWLFAFMDKNRDGQVDPTEYAALQDYKKKHGNAWEGQARKELKATK